MYMSSEITIYYTSFNDKVCYYFISGIENIKLLKLVSPRAIISLDAKPERDAVHP
jgi:hypothetical protein